MNDGFFLQPANMQLAQRSEELSSCNEISRQFGLELTGEQMQRLSMARVKALGDTGRVEFGGGILKKLVYAFCDSPYLNPSNYAETLEELQQIFYYLKNESMEQWTDDELIDAMNTLFHGKAQGCCDYLADMLIERCRSGEGAAEPWEEEPEEGEGYDD